MASHPQQAEDRFLVVQMTNPVGIKARFDTFDFAQTEANRLAGEAHGSAFGVFEHRGTAMVQPAVVWRDA